MRRPLRRWSGWPLDTILQSDIREFLNAWQAEGAKPGTLERGRVLLAGLFRAALHDKKIADNPMAHIGAIKTTPRDRVLSREHEALLRGLVVPQWERFLTVASTTGLRRGELLGLRPVDRRENGTSVGYALRRTRCARGAWCRFTLKRLRRSTSRGRPGTPSIQPLTGSVRRTRRRF